MTVPGGSYGRESRHALRQGPQGTANGECAPGSGRSLIPNISGRCSSEYDPFRKYRIPAWRTETYWKLPFPGRILDGDYRPFVVLLSKCMKDWKPVETGHLYRAF